jgi:protein-tyrosine-phosphatase
MPDFDAASAPIPSPAPRTIVFVCTGNTCRSPLAAGLAQRMLAERLGVASNELAARGYTIRSAGVAAYPGDAASAESVAIAAELGVDLTQHRSRLVNPEVLSDATHVIAMTFGHAAALMMRFPGSGPTPVLLCGEADLPDPIGGPLEEYRLCAQIIEQALQVHLEEWLR